MKIVDEHGPLYIMGFDVGFECSDDVGVDELGLKVAENLQRAVERLIMAYWRMVVKGLLGAEKEEEIGVLHVVQEP